MTTPRRSIPIPLRTIDYPGQHDFVVVASDGVRFNLSRTVLASASTFFADMFTVGEPVSRTRSSEEPPVNAAEDSSILDALFSISYAHPSRPRPTIDSFPQLVALTRAAEKYGMHQALDYLSTQLVLPCRVAGTMVEPFTVTHPVASLALAITHGFSIPACLALREVLNAGGTVWDITQEDEGLNGLTLDYKILKRIIKIRATRFEDYKGFIQGLQPCTSNACDAYYKYSSLGQWTLDLLKKANEAPNVAAFTTAFFTGQGCSDCGVNMNLANSAAFQTFRTAQAAREAQLPQLYQSKRSHCEARKSTSLPHIPSRFIIEPSIRVDAKRASSTSHVLCCNLNITLRVLHHVLFTNVCSDDVCRFALHLDLQFLRCFFGETQTLEYN